MRPTPAIVSWEAKGLCRVAFPTDRDTACGVREEHRRHHQWALAFMADDFRLPPPPIVVGGGGRRGGGVVQVRPQSARDWLWVQVAQLPPPDPQFHSTSLERAYVRALQGRQARSVLERIAVAFDAVVP